MKKLDEVLASKGYGIHFGNRILLPFKCHILKAVFENDIIYDFSHSKSGACYTIRDQFTEIYFHGVKRLEDKVGKYRGVRLIVVEEDKDIFDFNNHKKLALYILEDHKVEIDELSGDILFFE